MSRRVKQSESAMRGGSWVCRRFACLPSVTGWTTQVKVGQSQRFRSLPSLPLQRCPTRTSSGCERISWRERYVHRWKSGGACAAAMPVGCRG